MEAAPTPEQARDAVRLILRYLGEDPTREGLLETPHRFIEWITEFRLGRGLPRTTSFDGETYNQMVVVRDITFTSLCEHHLLPFYGTVAVAYVPVPGGRIIGLSKLARIVEWAAKRLQVQERMTEQISEALCAEMGCPDVGVLIKAEHMCMAIRGVQKPGHCTITSSLRGDFLSDGRTRTEFLGLTGH